MPVESGQTPTIGIIGAGRVGTALVTSLAACGYQITAVYSRTPKHAAQLAGQTNSAVVAAPEEVVAFSDLTLLTVSDDAIVSVATAITEQLARPVSSPKAVVHTSGVHTRESLAGLAALGLMTGSLHPALPVANALPTQTSHPFDGAAFALEADHPLLVEWLEQAVSSMGGKAFRLSEDQKVLYHTALVMASNYTVSLYAFAEQLLTGVGLSNADADAILNPLLQATVENLERQGIPDALTGPLVRADTGTLRRHLQALQQYAPEGLKAYRALARLSYPLLSARGVALHHIEQLLQQDESAWPE